MKLTKILAFLFVVMLVLAGCGSDNGDNNGNGDDNGNDNGDTEETETLTGKAQGFGGVITVTVTREGDTITNIEVEADDETPGLSDPAIEEIPANIVEENSTDVDVISEATVTSQGIIDAVNNALDPENYPFEEAEAEVREEVELADNGLYTGFGAAVSIADSEDNTHNSVSVSVGLTLDQDDQIVELQGDAMLATIEWDEEGILLVDGDEQIESAKQSGDAEWVDAITAFEAEAVGKTLDEVKDLDGDDNTELLIDATEKAIDSKLSLGAVEGDTLGFGVINELVYDQGSHSRDASEDGDGQAQAYHSYAVVTVDDSGTMTSVIIDSTQANVNFDQEGNITNDVSEPVETKIELGDRYGMRGISDIDREWNEQAWSIADYAQDKTLDEFLAVEVDDSSYITDVDLVSSATIQINEITVAVENAVNNAE